MTLLQWLIVAGVGLIAGICTGVVRVVALGKGLVDVPNARSSHTVSTPRGGGIGIVFGVVVGLAVLQTAVTLPTTWVAALAVSIAVAIVGLIDDRRPVAPAARFLVHLVAAAWVLFVLRGVPALQVGAWMVDLGVTGYVLGIIAIVWTLNLFNFMDGVDGLAAAEAAFISGAGGLIALLRGGPPELATIAFVFAAASLGFLWWNWPPAKIFMGDVGSGFLGFCIAVMALLAYASDPAAPFVWLILGGVFFVDATVTLVRRMTRRENYHQAHRTHAYQWLSRRWGSHRKVTLSVLAVNLFWLLPIALVADCFPFAAVWLAPVALLPLVCLAIASGAGCPEQTVPK